MKLLSRGNRKIPTATAIFNLPAVMTCPGSTAQCRKYCYARKAEKQYPAVLPFRNRNWEQAKLDTFVDVISNELSRARTIKSVRIHESGDFYNQAYFDKWKEVAEKRPDLTFYAYTKNSRIDISTRPSNFVILLSDDKAEHKDIWDKFNGVATVTPKGSKPDKDFIICPGSCKTCSLCKDVTENNRITFLEH